MVSLLPIMYPLTWRCPRRGAHPLPIKCAAHSLLCNVLQAKWPLVYAGCGRSLGCSPLVWTTRSTWVEACTMTDNGRARKLWAIFVKFHVLFPRVKFPWKYSLGKLPCGNYRGKFTGKIPSENSLGKILQEKLLTLAWACRLDRSLGSTNQCDLKPWGKSRTVSSFPIKTQILTPLHAAVQVSQTKPPSQRTSRTSTERHPTD